jgi:hypothetical protein
VAVGELYGSRQAVWPWGKLGGVCAQLGIRPGVGAGVRLARRRLGWLVRTPQLGESRLIFGIIQ